MRRGKQSQVLRELGDRYKCSLEQRGEDWEGRAAERMVSAREALEEVSKWGEAVS